MIDVNEFTYELPSGDGVTLYHDVYDGFCMLGRTRSGALAGVCIEENDTMDGRYFDPEESRHRIFLGNCRIEVDPASTVDVKSDLMVGEIIISPTGISVVGRGTHGRGPAYLTLFGESLVDRYDGFAFSKWSIVRDKPGQLPVVIFKHSARGLVG
jgi:hypothetical protein